MEPAEKVAVAVRLGEGKMQGAVGACGLHAGVKLIGDWWGAVALRLADLTAVVVAVAGFLGEERC